MDLNLSGRRALVTGASKGIGQAVARQLHDEGCHVTLVARNAAALVAAVQSIGSNTSTIVADLADEATRRGVAEQAGTIDILVNNAGGIPGGALNVLDEPQWRQSWELKLFGFISLCRLVYPRMADRKAGVIVNIIGNAGERPDPDYIAGSTANAGLMAFTRALGRQGARDGVRVVGINPGLVMTERAEMLLKQRAQTELGASDRWKDLLRDLPFGRPAQPEEIGAAVAFLASDRAAYCNGTILTIDGGA